MLQANVTRRSDLPLSRFSLLLGRFNAKGDLLFQIDLCLTFIRGDQAIMFFGFYLKPFLGVRR